MITTERLLLRRWQEADRAPFAAINADAEVMAHYEAPLSREQSDALIDRITGHFDDHGYGLWAVEHVESAELIGFVGLQALSWEAHFTPCVEIGWRLARPAWGNGYATEGARAALAYGFETLGLNEIVAMAVPGNMRSLAVMDRLGMTRDADGDFEHPLVPEGSPRRLHVLYRIAAG